MWHVLTESSSEADLEYPLDREKNELKISVEELKALLFLVKPLILNRHIKIKVGGFL